MLFADTGGISPTEAAISSTVDLQTLQRAAVYLDKHPEEIAHYSRRELRDAARAFDRSVNRGAGLPDSPFSSGLGAIDFQRAVAEGSDVIAGIDLSDIDPSLISGRGKDILRAAGYDPDNDPIDVQDLIDSGVGAGELRRSFAQTLTNLGLLDTNTGTTGSGAGIYFNQSNVDLLRQGLFPEQRQVREALAERAASLAGSLDPDTFTNDPYVQAALQTNRQGVRAAFSSRGLNNSGAAAFAETASGLQLLEQLRIQREQEALALTDAGGGLALGGSAGLGAGQFQSQVFQQNFGTALAHHQQALAAEQARDIARAGSFPSLFQNSFAGAFGSSLGTLAGIGGILGGSNSGTATQVTPTAGGGQQTTTSQTQGGTGLAGIISQIFA